MGVLNVMEAAVKRAVSAYGGEKTGAPPSCRCLLCVRDVTALALANLPPRYCCTGGGHGAQLPIEGRQVEDAVSAAAVRVRRYPRHPEAVPEWSFDSVTLKNFVLDEVADLVAVDDTREGPGCRCDLCTTDIMAYSLNRFPPRYGVLWRGSCAFPEYQRQLMRQELQMVLSRASAVVAKRPRHRCPGSELTDERRNA